MLVILTSGIALLTVPENPNAVNVCITYDAQTAPLDSNEMRPIKSIVDKNSESYRGNYAANLVAVERLKSELKKSTLGGGEQYVKRHLARGKLPPRERVEMLLDEGSYFLEIAPLAGHEMENEFIGAGVVGGVGLVSGRQCLIIANEATVKGGAVSEIGQRKNARLAEIAATNHLATITLVESAGADLPVQSKIFVPGGAVTLATICPRAREIADPSRPPSPRTAPA